jgi:succinate dehydrogenase / fumarate reductase membrane anchor subunit
MVKSISSLTNSGVHDWLWQRLSAIVVAAYTLFIFLFLLINTLGSANNLSYATWHGLFGMLWMKIATVIFMVALIVHIWIGIWTVLTDYVHCAFIRNTLLFLFNIGYLIYLIWTISILWR